MADRPSPIAVTRVSNACVLLEVDGCAVLTDPWFRRHWAFNEAPGVRVDQLPHLAAILGSHRVFDHWDVESLSAYADKAVPVLVPHDQMAAQARREGFSRVEVAEWGTRRRVGPTLTIDVLEAQLSRGVRINNYVLDGDQGRVFFGGEALALEPLRRYRYSHPPVDLFVGPCNGIRLLGRQLVMGAASAVEAAQILGARGIVPVHYAHRRLGPLAAARDTANDVRNLAAGTGIQVMCLPPGVRWEWVPPGRSEYRAG